MLREQTWRVAGCVRTSMAVGHTLPVLMIITQSSAYCLISDPSSKRSPSRIKCIKYFPHLLWAHHPSVLVLAVCAYVSVCGEYFMPLIERHATCALNSAAKMHVVFITWIWGMRVGKYIVVGYPFYLIVWLKATTFSLEMNKLLATFRTSFSL